MAKRLGIYTLGHYMSLNHVIPKKLWNPLLQNDEFWELTELSTADYGIIEESMEGMLITHEQILNGFFSLAERVECLKRIKAEFNKNFNNLVQILSMEVHKPLTLSQAECHRCLKTIEACIELGEQLLKGNTSLTGSTPSFHGESLPVPRKLVLGMTPFNFPLNLCLHKIAPALLAGAPLLWRPSSKGQFTALALVDILQAAKVPAGLFAFLPMSNECFWKLLKDPRIDAVSFTGSAAVGWEIHKEFRGAMVLELGGSAPLYLEKLKGEELKKALFEIVSSAFSYAGQSCISAQTLFVHKDIFEESRKILIDLTLHFACGISWDEKTLCSGVIDEAAKIRIENLIKKTISDGSIVHRTPLNETTKKIPNFVAPALIEKPNENLLKEEAFAPLLNLLEGDFETFKSFANSLPQRLQCGVFSSDSKTLEKAKNLDFGGISLNGTSSQRVDALPYGGRGLAGLGAENPASSYSFFAPYKTFYSKIKQL